MQLVHQDIQGSVEFQDTRVQVYLDIQGLVDILELDRLGLAVQHLLGLFQDKGSKC